MSFLICTGGFGFLLWSTFGAVGGIVHIGGLLLAAV